MPYLGDIAEDATIDFSFTSRQFSTGAPFTLAGTPSLAVYKANGDTESTAGITLTADFDAKTGLNQVRIDTSADAFYAVANDYYVVIAAGTVDSVSVVGEVVGEFSIENRFAEVDMVAISGDTTAADNLESQYDTTGVNGDTFPATQSQVSQIGSGGGSANNEFAILSPNGFVITTGLSEVNNEDATRAVGGDVHQVSDNAGTLDVYYLHEIGGAFSPNTIVFDGRMNGNNDDVGVYVNTNTQASPTWVQRATLEGQASTVNLRHVWPLVNTDQMVGVDAGKVAVRFQATGLSSATLTTDQILVEKTTIASVTGYQDGQVWVNTVSGIAGTVVNVNGVADKAVDLWASAVTIASTGGFANDFHIINGSTIALTGNSDNFSLFGDNWTLQLESRSVAGAYFQGAIVSGVGTSSSEVHYEGCEVQTMSVQIGHFDFCSFAGTVTHTLAGDYNYHNCYSMVAGPNGPTFAKTAGQTITAQWRGWKGSINLTGLEVGDTLTIGGEELGTIDLGSPAGAVVVEIRGIYKALANVGSASVNLEGAINASDVTLILADTNELQTDDVPGLISVLQDDLDIITGSDGTTLATSQPNYAPAVAGDEMNLVNDAITNAKIADDALAAEQFATGAFTADAFAADALIAATFATDSFTADAMATSWSDEIADGVADEVLTAATHNVPSSLGRRIRQISSNILGPFSVTSATANAVTLDADAGLSEVAGSYDPSRILVHSGTGADQSGVVTEYFGSAGGNGNAARTLIFKEDFKVTLDNTSEIFIIISDGRSSTNQGQLRGGSTTTATLNALSPMVDITGQTLHFTSGTGQDQVALITSYSDPVATFSAIDVAVDATTGYELLPFGMATVEAIQGDTQSATDLKDFVDDGYDPGTNKITGIGSTGLGEIWSYDVSGVEDIAGVFSGTHFVLAFENSDTTTNAGSRTTFKSDGSTEFAQTTLSTDPSAEPIDGVGG